MWDFKTRILHARVGIFEELNIEAIDIKEGANLPGYIISNSVMGFAIVVFLGTIGFTFLLWPLFWMYLWSIRLLVFTILIPSIVMGVLEGWVQDYAYEQYYVKR
jgi:hypothetical protein